MIKYATTSRDIFYQEYDPDGGRFYSVKSEDEDLSPIPPDKCGEWEMVGSACSERRLFWFWRTVVAQHGSSGGDTNE